LKIKKYCNYKTNKMDKIFTLNTYFPRIVNYSSECKVFMFNFNDNIFKLNINKQLENVKKYNLPMISYNDYRHSQR
jgi:hypothetical protein